MNKSGCEMKKARKLFLRPLAKTIENNDQNFIDFLNSRKTDGEKKTGRLTLGEETEISPHL
jgi:hypothetical protein